MDPVSFVASLCTIAEVGVQLVKFSNKLYHAARNKGAVADDVKFVANDIGVAADCFTIALNTLRKKNVIGEDSEVFQYLRGKRTLVKLNNSEKQIRKRLRSLSGEIEKMDGKVKVWTSFQWIYTLRPRIAQTMEIVRSLHGSMSLILASAQLESNHHDASRTADPVFKSRLAEDRDILSAQLEIIEQRLVSLEQTSLSNNQSMSRRHKSSRHVDILVELSSSFRHDGCAPGRRPASTRTSSASLRSPQGPETTCTNPTSLAENSGSSRLNEDFPLADESPVIQRSQQGEHQPLIDPDYDNKVGTNRNDFGNEDDQSEESSELSDHDYIPVVPQIFTPFVDITRAPAVTVHYKPKIVSRELKAVTGKVVNGLSINAMSCAMAIRLGIEFSSIIQGEGDPLFLEFVGGQKRLVMGETGPIQLHKSPVMNHKCLNVQFWIYEHYSEEIVLGQSFVEHRDYYWDKTIAKMPTE